MNVDVELQTEAAQFLFWEYLFRIFGIVSLRLNSKQFFILSHGLRLANLFELRTGFNSNEIEDICNW
jgi:hypothetical protein